MADAMPNAGLMIKVEVAGQSLDEILAKVHKKNQGIEIELQRLQVWHADHCGAAAAKTTTPHPQPIFTYVCSNPRTGYTRRGTR